MKKFLIGFIFLGISTSILAQYAGRVFNFNPEKAKGNVFVDDLLNNKQVNWIKINENKYFAVYPENLDDAMFKGFFRNSGIMTTDSFKLSAIQLDKLKDPKNVLTYIYYSPGENVRGHSNGDQFFNFKKQVPPNINLELLNDKGRDYFAIVAKDDIPSLTKTINGLPGARIDGAQAALKIPELNIRVVEGTFSSFSNSALTKALAENPKIEKIQISPSRHYLAYPPELEAEVAKGLRDLGINSPMDTKIGVNDLAAIKNGKVSLVALNVQVAKENLDSTNFSAVSNYETQVKGLKVPEGVRYLDKKGPTIFALVPSEEVSRFQIEVIDRLPTRMSYISRSIPTKGVCTSALKKAFKF